MNLKADKKGLSGLLKKCGGDQVNIRAGKTRATAIEAIIAAVWYDCGNDMGEIRKLLDLLLGTNLVREWEVHYPSPT